VGLEIRSEGIEEKEVVAGANEVVAGANYE
jgi:hypothetical protein